MNKTCAISSRTFVFSSSAIAAQIVRNQSFTSSRERETGDEQ